MLANPFYVERCPNCQGLWCDHGEWDILETLGLHTTIDQLFSAEWQTQIRQIQQMSKERQATIEKLGTELANLVFEVGEKLKEHPNGDFGVAYLMRQISES
jgi:Zn-finger nucleic acid-binding protein